MPDLVDQQPVDEMVDGQGGLRRAWRGVIEPVLTLGPGQLERRSQALRRAAAEEGAAWHCDPVPLPMPAAEFARLAAGLAQRATLIERVLADIYGPQTLLASGALPPSLVFGSRNFIRPARHAGLRAGRRMLHLYAADLVRGPDGAWRVIADRCAKPSGIAAVLENRRMLRRVVPELFGAPIRGLRGFFEEWRDAMRASLSPEGGIALLTDGRGSFGPHEPGLLARELGAHLVHGSDLTLRSGRLWVKSLRGLKQVDLVINRQPACLLDPLELDWDDGAGVPGLMAVMREGGVAMMNDPGAGLGGDPALGALLPQLAPVVLDEELDLPAEERVWLGDREGRARVLADPAPWWFLSAHNAEARPVAHAELSPRAREKLRAAIEAAPARLVAARPVERSLMPTLVAGALEPRPVVVRLFLRQDASGWTALPGGLVRAGGVTKDLFVLPDGDEHAAALRVETLPHRLPLAALAIRRVEADLPARVAGAFSALGARLERLESDARRLRALALRLGRYTERPQELIELRILAAAVAPTSLLPAETLIDPAAPGLRSALARLAEPGSLLAARVAGLAGAIDNVGDRMSGEMLSVLHQGIADAGRAFAGERGDGSLDGVAHVANRLLGLAASLSGLAAETMVRGGGWLFFDIGLRLARTDSACTLLAAALGPAAQLPRPRPGVDGPPDIDTALAILLELAHSAIAYRGRYGLRLEPATVLDLLIADRDNPRALAFQFAALRADFERLREVGGAEFAAHLARMAGEANAVVTRIVAAPAPAAETVHVPEAAARLKREVEHMRARIRRRYFDLLPEVRTFAT